jgi:hypothetical protein
MQPTEVITPRPLLEFEGTVRRAGSFLPGATIWCSAATCASAKAGYIISHQNRGWG